MGIYRNFLPLCVLGGLFSLNIFAEPYRPAVSMRSQVSMVAPISPASKQVRPIGPGTPNQQNFQGNTADIGTTRSSMPAGLMRIPTTKSNSDAVTDQEVESDKKRVSAGDVYRAWGANASPTVVSGEYPHQNGVVQQFSDPFTGRVQGYELKGFDGTTWPYNPSTGEVMHPQTMDAPTLESGQSSRRVEQSTGSNVSKLREVTLANGSNLKFNSATGEVIDSKEYSIGPSGNPVESTLYVDLSSGTPVVQEYNREVTSTGNELVRVRNMSNGATRVYYNGVPVSSGSDVQLTISPQGAVYY